MQRLLHYLGRDWYPGKEVESQVRLVTLDGTRLKFDGSDNVTCTGRLVFNGPGSSMARKDGEKDSTP
jgi:hypothetical protein